MKALNREQIKHKKMLKEIASLTGEREKEHRVEETNSIPIYTSSNRHTGGLVYLKLFMVAQNFLIRADIKGQTTLTDIIFEWYWASCP